jgi:ketosteroid isomerase-like protein
MMVAIKQGLVVTFKIICQNLLDEYVASYRAMDAVGCASVFSTDAELYSPYGPPAIGRAAIEAIHREWVAEGADEKEIKVVDAGVSEDVGWCVAHFSEGATGSGRSLNVLERQLDGNWLISRCSINDAP